MLTVIVIILGLALILYTVLGGADFGAGILEIFTGRRHEKIISEAIAPVWEANHVWLILVVVILFVAFPPIYATVSLYLHIPLLLALIGIIFRGTAFAFRHYDVVKERTAHRYYGHVFRYASLLTPFFMGMTLGATMLGRINPEASTFAELFLWPWFNLFSASLGLFTVALFAYLAAVFLVGEAEVFDQHLDSRYPRYALSGSVGTGLLVFGAAHFQGFPLLALFWNSPLSLVCIAVTTLLIPFLLAALRKGRIWWTRLLVGAQVGLILLGWFAIQYPVVIRLYGHPDLTLLNSRAPDTALFTLLIAIVVGTPLVIPAFGYLFWVFKFAQNPPQPK
ncbi:MAG: cytochrome d ubiquinol oxidase subunit II [Acidobacteria bacterium]|nr:cytochrome d ubiquinol oxidase subunit II [Acidobacteriota bacterium]